MSDKFLISNEHLIRLAGKPAFNRGMGYFRDGHVLRLQQKGNRITAEVEGSENIPGNTKMDSQPA